jgi:hypothetical protein
MTGARNQLTPGPARPGEAGRAGGAGASGGPRGWWLSLGVPGLVSLGVHAALAGALMVGTGWITFGSADEPTSEGPAAGGVVIDLAPFKTRERAEPPAPSTPTETSPSPAERAAVAAAPAAGPSESARGSGARVGAGERAPAAEVGRSASVGAAMTGGGESAIGVAFAGLSAQRTRSVVYVVDASGPMVTTLPQVLALVTRSVSDLTPTQRFSVVLFRDVESGGGGGGVEVFQPRVVDATPRNRARLRDFLEGVRPRGRSNPLAGLRAALAMRPQVVFLLTRSIERSGGGQWEQGLERTLAELDSLNPIDPATGRRAVVIKTIQFLDEDPTGIMRGIATQHGERARGEGRAADQDYRVLPAEELPR